MPDVMSEDEKNAFAGSFKIIPVMYGNPARHQN